MTKSDNRQVIISLGGSLIYTSNGLNIDFLKQFNALIRKHVSSGTKFFIVCGGGRISRNYQGAAREAVGAIPDEDIDWLGIHTTRMNAQLLRTIFADICYQKVIYHYDEKEPPIKQSVVIAAGWKPGRSTDYCAVLLARTYGAKTIINLSNIEMVYDKDPKKYEDAKPLKQVTWDDFSKIVGDKWSPGANLPFDPIATKLSRSLKLKVYIMDGANLGNLDNALRNKPFKGTIILPTKRDSTYYDKEYFELGVGYKGYTTTKQGKSASHLNNFYRALLIRAFINPKTVLDVGCATGLLVYYLRRMGVEAYGVDTSEYAISKAYPLVKKYLGQGSILNIPYPANKFELVVTLNVLEHLNKSEIVRALAECDRVSTLYTYHKVYTVENSWMNKFHGDNRSRITNLPKIQWEEIIEKEGYKNTPLFLPKLPLFMETTFLLNKRNKTNSR